MKRLTSILLVLCICLGAIPAFSADDGIVWKRTLSMKFSQQEREEGLYNITSTEGFIESYPEDGGYKVIKSVKQTPHVYINTTNPNPSSTSITKVGFKYKTDFPNSSEVFRFVMFDTSGTALLVAYCRGNQMDFGTSTSSSSRFASVSVPINEVVEVGALIDPVKKIIKPIVNGEPIGKVTYNGIDYEGYHSTSGKLPAGGDVIFYMSQGSSYFQMIEYYIDQGVDVGNEIQSAFYSDEPVNKITKDLTFAQSLPSGATLSYVSSKPEVIDNTGRVTRGKNDESVKITVTGDYEGQSISLGLNFIVMAENKEEKNIWIDESNFEGSALYWNNVTDGGSVNVSGGKLELLRNTANAELSAIKYFVTNLASNPYHANGENVLVETYVKCNEQSDGGQVAILCAGGETAGEYVIRKVNGGYVFEYKYADGSNVFTSSISYEADREIFVKYDINTYTGDFKIYVDNAELDSSIQKKILYTDGISAIKISSLETASAGSMTVDNVALLVNTDNKALATAKLDIGNIKLFDTKNPSADMISSNLSLPTRGDMGSAFSYSSNNEEVLDSMGFVTRGEEDEEVTITVSATFEGFTAYKTFVLTVKGIDPKNLAFGTNTYSSKSIEGYAKENAIDGINETAWRTDESPYYIIGFDQATVINKVLLKEARNSENVFGVTEFSVDISDNNKTWTTVATDTGIRDEKIILLDEVKTKYIRYKVISMTGTDTGLFEFAVYYEPAVETAFMLDKDTVVLGGDYVVKGNLLFITSCKFGSSVAWKSSDPDIISNTGVLRSVPSSDTIITLTAVITNGNYSTTKTFKRLVKGEKSGSASGGKGSGGNTSKTGSIATSGIVTAIDSTTKPEVISNIFVDVENDRWSYPYLKELKDENVISGNENGEFKPQEDIKREDFIKMLLEALAITTEEADESDFVFEDVPEDAWYGRYIRTAVALGITKGESGTMFGTGKSITRQDMAVLTVNALKAANLSIGDKGTVQFEDNSMIADYALDAVRVLVNGGIINGMEGKFLPNNSLTREQTAKIICLIRKESR